MVKAYLIERKQTCEKEKIKVEKKIQELKEQQEKKVQVLKSLEESEDSSYESFSPRNIKIKNKDKIEEVLAQQEQIQAQLTQQNEKLAECAEKIKKAEEVLTAYEKEKNCCSEKEKSNDLPQETLKNILYKIQLCSKLIDLDPHRCKLEIDCAIKMIQKELEHTKDNLEENAQINDK